MVPNLLCTALVTRLSTSLIRNKRAGKFKRDGSGGRVGANRIVYFMVNVVITLTNSCALDAIGFDSEIFGEINENW